MLAQEAFEVDPALDPRAVESWLISQRQPAHGMAAIDPTVDLVLDKRAVVSRLISHRQSANGVAAIIGCVNRRKAFHVPSDAVYHYTPIRTRCLSPPPGRKPDVQAVIPNGCHAPVV